MARDLPLQTCLHSLLGLLSSLPPLAHQEPVPAISFRAPRRVPRQELLPVANLFAGPVCWLLRVAWPISVPVRPYGSAIREQGVGVGEGLVALASGECRDLAAPPSEYAFLLGEARGGLSARQCLPGARQFPGTHLRRGLTGASREIHV
jgi:hypothetical protein